MKLLICGNGGSAAAAKALTFGAMALAAYILTLPVFLFE